MNEADIITLLDKGLIGGYGTDVLENENDNIKKSNLIKKMRSPTRL